MASPREALGLCGRDPPQEKEQVVGGITQEINAAVEGRASGTGAAWQPHGKPAGRHLSVWCTGFKFYFLN